MRCPKCEKKMEFNHDIKDYHCDNCGALYKEILKEEKQKTSGSDGNGETEGENEDIKSEKMDIYNQPGMGTVKGILFTMFGSLILMLSILLEMVCIFIGIIGLFLLIIGFFMAYQDRKSQTKEHELLMRNALIFFIAWIVIYLIINIYFINIGSGLTNELDKFEGNQTLPENLIVEYIEDFELIIFLNFPMVILLGCFRFLTIKSLIQIQFRKLLTIALILIIISVSITTYLNLDFYNSKINNLEDTSKDDFITSNINTTDEDVYGNQIDFYYEMYLLSFSGEAIMLLCYFWTWRSKKDEFTT